MYLEAGLTQVIDDGTNTYLYGMSRIAQYDASGPQYFLGDALGSVRQIADADGNLTLGRRYKPYGEVLVAAGDGVTSYGFTGEWTDGSMGDVYLRARWYAPSQGRFLTKDMWEGDFSKPLSLNGWNYVKANPINFVDPTGLVACSPNFRYCKIIDGPYTGFFIDTHHWDDSRLLSQRIKNHLKDLFGVYLGKFEESVLLAGYAPYKRTYYTVIPMSSSDTILDGVTLGILMDYNYVLEKYEGLDPTCWATKDGVIKNHLCSSFSNEDLPSAYLGFVAYKNNWNLKETMKRLVDNIEEDTEGINQFPEEIAVKFFDAQNRCFSPRTFDTGKGKFINQSWPSEIVYDSIGPGKYWSTSPNAFIQPIPTPPPPRPTPTT